MLTFETHESMFVPTADYLRMYSLEPKMTKFTRKKVKNILTSLQVQARSIMGTIQII